MGGGGPGVSCGSSGSAAPRARSPFAAGLLSTLRGPGGGAGAAGRGPGPGCHAPTCGSAGGLGARGRVGLRGAEAAWEPAVRSVRVLDTHRWQALRAADGPWLQAAPWPCRPCPGVVGCAWLAGAFQERLASPRS